MILKQEFKTSKGASKRAAFENAHSDKYKYNVVRFFEGERDTKQFDAALWRLYTWRLERVWKR